MPNVTITQSTPGALTVGDIVEFQLVTSADFPEFLGFQTQLQYDASVLSLEEIVFASALADLAFAPPEPAGASGITTIAPILGSVGTNAQLTGPVVAATFRFEILTTDAVDISLLPFNGLFFATDVGDGVTQNIPLENPVTTSFNLNDAPTGAVLITGDVAEDGILTADASGLADADGLGALSYQWLADGVAIAGATGETLALTQAEVGAAISVVVSYTDGGGAEESVTSAQTAPVANVNDAPTGAVLITGDVAEDGILTADASGLADADGLGPLSYQWLADGVAIAGATGETLALTQAEVGAAISVVVSYTDGGGAEESVTSAQTAPVANVNDAPTGAVLITGDVAEDGILTADASGLADADGLGALSYQWLADGVAIAGATGETLALTQAEVGAAISVVVSYTDGGGAEESVTSAQTAPVANVNDAPTGAVLITGDVAEDGILTADASGLADADGLGPLSYQWLADGVAIAGATGETLALTQAEVGAAISVVVSYTDGGGAEESVTSAQTAPVANVNDAPTGAVLITGDVAEDGILTADASGLADADGLGPLSYQWLADGVAIAGATGETLALTQAEVGAAISVVVSYTDGGGAEESVTSAQTAPVANVNDAPTGAVLITGTATEGETLTASNDLADLDGLSGPISYQWQADGVDIAGATSAIFELTAAQVGAEITVVASYIDDQGTPENVSSDPTAVVVDSNEPPVADDDAVMTDEDTPVTINVLANDTDPDGGVPAEDEVLYRVNVGGPAVVVGLPDAANPGDPDLDWGGDTGSFGNAGNSQYLVANSTGTSTFDSTSGSSYAGLATFTDASIPSGTPGEIFQTERYDGPGAPEMQWQFPVGADFGLQAGDEVIVRLYFAELFTGVDAAGERVFDVSVEGAIPVEFDDIDPFDVGGANGGFMLDTVATIDADGTLDLEFIHGIENPALKGIEILQAGAATPGNAGLTVELVTGPSNGAAVVNADGTITYTPDADYNGPDSFIYEVTDADGATDTATVDIGVTPVNDAPVLAPLADAFSFVEGASGPVFTASATDIDVGDTLSFSLTGDDADLFDIDEFGAVTLSATTPPVFTIADEDIATVADVTQSLNITVNVSDGTDTVSDDVVVSFLKDTDGDGIEDAMDNALFVFNPDQRDSNGDGYGNVIDVDLNNDGIVDLNDLSVFRADFGTNGNGVEPGPTEGLDADFNGDGNVDAADINTFRAYFGQSIESLSLVGDSYFDLG